LFVYSFSNSAGTVEGSARHSIALPALLHRDRASAL
jgi:hypothetical protein